MYPSILKREKKGPNQLQPEIQAVSFTLRPIQWTSRHLALLLVIMFHTLATMLSPIRELIMVHADGIVFTAFLWQNAVCSV